MKLQGLSDKAVSRIAKSLKGQENNTNNKSDWIGVDLDGTLAYYDEWKGIEHIGKPIPLMVDRVKKWLKDGKEVKIMTARAYGKDADLSKIYIENWLEEHIGQILPITYEKDKNMVELWDDRAVQVVKNTGERVDGEK